jgi:DNA-binding response OmpR family regulator
MVPIAKQVLLVEDDKNIRELYAMALIKAGVHILMAEDGDQGVRMALKHRPTLVLLDIDMPIMNGYAVAQTLRTDVWGATVPIIFLTNRCDPRDQAHASVHLPDRYIIKVNTPVKEVVAQVLLALR